MSWLEQDKSETFHVRFRFGGTKYRRSLKTKTRKIAETRLHRLEENIRLVESGRLVIPSGADVAAFLLSDGKLNGPIRTVRGMDISTMFSEFLRSLPKGTLEQTTLRCIGTHRRHIERILGATSSVEQLSVRKLQRYVTKRSEEPGLRGHTVGTGTIRREMKTLSMVWQWAVDNKHIEGVCPKQGIRYPKEREKPPFQTWREIEQRIEAGRLSKHQQAELWDCVFLTLDEIDAVLSYVREKARTSFIYPMMATAAYTGARRSELIRSSLADLGDTSILLRERKRVRGKRSFRRVPITPKLRTILDDWLAIHPGGDVTFCSRPNTEISFDIARGDFEKTLRDSEWQTIPGWHCFRHSFISNCAMRGVDQRMIDTWVGHQTDEMRRRYRHLFPDTELAAIQTVFT